MKKKVGVVLSFLLLLLLFPLGVKANSISSIDMDIYVDENGTGHVTETWKAYLSQGTEGYKPYYNIGNAKITNFSVSENGKVYQYDDYWNPNGSFEEKAYKNGINYVSNGLELCWGISEYGNHTYTLKYDIEGFVSSLTDADMIYWNLVPHDLSSKPSNVHIKIYADEAFKDTLDVWGYGNYGGTTYVYDGYIEMNSEGTLQSDEYMTLLVKFDKGTFNTYNTLNNDFNYYYEMAKEGATAYKESNSTSIISFLFPFIFTAFWIFLIGSIIKNGSGMVGNRKMNFEKDAKKLPKDIPNYRDIPFDKNIYRAYWVAVTYNLIKKQTDFLGAIILKWVKEQKIGIKKVMEGTIIKKDATTLDLTKPFSSDNQLEIDLYNMMYEASKDGYLESKEFEKWCNKNYKKILDWFKKVLDDETDKLVAEGKVIIKAEKHPFVKIDKYYVTNEMKDEAVKLKGFKNFLEEFSRINEKEPIEVNMWEYYLIYAQILGLADRVAKQFKKLYPELINNPNYDYDYDDFIFINMICYSGMNAASASQSRAQSYSSGGGGFSSGGGGGGSFGGGGGGGGFR